MGYGDRLEQDEVELGLGAGWQEGKPKKKTEKQDCQASERTQYFVVFLLNLSGGRQPDFPPAEAAPIVAEAPGLPEVARPCWMAL
jgi:hypothetical protein